MTKREIEEDYRMWIRKECLWSTFWESSRIPTQLQCKRKPEEQRLGKGRTTHSILLLLWKKNNKAREERTNKRDRNTESIIFLAEKKAIEKKILFCRWNRDVWGHRTQKIFAELFFVSLGLHCVVSHPFVWNKFEKSNLFFFCLLFFWDSKENLPEIFPKKMKFVFSVWLDLFFLKKKKWTPVETSLNG